MAGTTLFMYSIRVCTSISVTATAADLITARLGTTAAERKAALRRVAFDGDTDAVAAMRQVFRLSADPGLAAV